MGQTVWEMIRKHKTAVLMAAQVMSYLNQGRSIWFLADDFYITKLTVPGVDGAHGVPALQLVVVATKEETERLYRRH